MQNLNLNEPLLERWLNGALLVPGSAFVPADAFPDLLFRPLLESKGVLGFFLKKEVDPYRDAQGVHWKAHAADPGGLDLLKSGEYEAAGLRLTITESRNVVIVEAARAGETLATAKSKRAYVDGLVQAVVQTDSEDQHWEFQLPGEIETAWEGRLISNKGASPLKDLESRHDRADILLLNGSVYFVFYKKIAQLENFLPDDQWFSPETRAAIAKKQGRP